MIEQYKDGDALEATEQLLLVPVARKALTAYDGFAHQVFQALPQARDLLQSVEGLYLGQTLDVGPGRAYNWPKKYTAILAAMHSRSETGWDDAPYILNGVLAQIHERFPGQQLAVAGAPGAGFSGLLGRADGLSIMKSMQVSRVPVIIYQRTDTSDREPLELATPLPSDQIAIAESVRT